MLASEKKRHLLKKPEDMNIPIYLDKDLRAFFFKEVLEKGLNAGTYINQILREKMNEMKKVDKDNC